MTPAPPASPCKNICELDTTDICTGCGRSTTEIADWISASDVVKEQIIQRAAMRLRQAKSGRASA